MKNLKKKILKIFILTIVYFIVWLGFYSVSLAYTFNNDLHQGSTGVDVQELQKALNSLSFNVALSGPGSLSHETTFFGPATKVAVSKFQNAYSLNPDGVFNSGTRVKMNELLNSSQSSETTVTSGTLLCNDSAATNNGGQLPCIYTPSTAQSCPTGQVWDSIVHLCVHATIETSEQSCPAGQTWNPSLSLCVCPVGQVFNITTNICTVATVDTTDNSITNSNDTSNVNTANNTNNSNSNSSTTGSVIRDISSPAGGLIPECPATGCGFKELMQLINNFIKFILFALAVPIAAIMFVYAGFEMVTSGGSVEKASKAKKIFANAAIGIALAAASWLIIELILSTLGYAGSWIGF